MTLVMVAYRWLLVWALRVLGFSALVWIGVTTRWRHLTDPGLWSRDFGIVDQTRATITER